MSQRLQGPSTLSSYSPRLALLLVSREPLPFQASMQAMFRGRNGASLLYVPFIVRKTSSEESSRLPSHFFSQDYGICLKKLKKELTYDLAIPLLGIYLEKNMV